MSAALTPYRRALCESGARLLDHPAARRLDMFACQRLVRLMNLLAEHGVYLDRPTASAPLNGFLTHTAGLPPECDHVHTLVDVRDTRPGRVVGILIEPYRRLGHVGAESGLSYAGELDAWCTANGVDWEDVTAWATHYPQARDAVAVLIFRRGQFPPALRLTPADREHLGYVRALAAMLAG